MIIAKNPLELHDYAEGLARQFDEIQAFVYLDSGENLDDRLQAYFNNDYQGCALFLGIFETDDTPNLHGLALATLNAQLTILDKVDATATGALIVTRSRLWQLALRVLGRIEMDYDEDRLNGDYDELPALVSIVPQRNRQLQPVTRPANVSAIGYAFEFDLRIPVNALKYAGAD